MSRYYVNKFLFTVDRDPDLLRRIRVHANFVEHVPIALLLLAILAHS